MKMRMRLIIGTLIQVQVKFLIVIIKVKNKIMKETLYLIIIFRLKVM